MSESAGPAPSETRPAPAPLGTAITPAVIALAVVADALLVILFAAIGRAAQAVIAIVMLTPHAVWHESALSFLGLGLQPDQPSLGTLLDQGRLGRAEVWMRYLRDLHPRFEGSLALYTRYAALLDAQGRGGEAEEWRQFTRELRAGTLYNLGPDAPQTMGQAEETALMQGGTVLQANLVSSVATDADAPDEAPLGIARSP